MIKTLTALCMLTSLPGATLAQDVGTKVNPHVLNPTVDTVAWGHYWADQPPALRIKSGDYVNIHTLITSNPERLEAAGVAPEDVEQELRNVQAVSDRGPGGHVLTGPIYVEGAEPGDTLEVRIHKVDLAIPYAYNAIGGNGFLSDEIFERKVRIIPLDRERMIGHFDDGIEIPLAPFFGSMGVAPPREAGRINSAPPWIHAGNLDNKELVAGTSLFIPVHIKGALFEAGDGHAAQGDGEVDITAIETSLKGNLQFIVHKGKTLTWPRAETPTHIITMGTDRNLTAATKIAAREMIKYLMEERGMTKVDAYMLSSLASDMRITQLVDGNKGVHAMIAKSIFTKNR